MGSAVRSKDVEEMDLCSVASSLPSAVLNTSSEFARNLSGSQFCFRIGVISFDVLVGYKWAVQAGQM